MKSCKMLVRGLSILGILGPVLFAGYGASARSAPPLLSITIVLSTATVPEGGSQSFTATVVGSSNTAVSWSVQEGATGGSVTGSGMYKAPNSGGAFFMSWSPVWRTRASLRAPFAVLQK
jgi:hypothetical protein